MNLARGAKAPRETSNHHYLITFPYIVKDPTMDTTNPNTRLKRELPVSIAPPRKGAAVPFPPLTPVAFLFSATK